MDDLSPPYRCPRCRSTDVELSHENYYPPGTPSAYEAWRIYDFECGNCGNTEEASDGDPATPNRFIEMVNRWANVTSANAATTSKRNEEP